jgi:putative transposase
MFVKQAFRYELKPNNKQKGLLIKHCGVARFAWNWALARRQELYKTHEGKECFTNAINQHRELNALKKTKFPWMYEVSKCAPQEALRNLDQAYANMIRRIKNHEKKIGKPKFKKKGIHDSFRLTGAINIGGNFFHLPRIGKIQTKEATSKLNGRILSATVSREADRWYCSLAVESDKTKPLPIKGDVIGIDLGITCFGTISNGIKIKEIHSPKPLRKNIKKLKRFHRHLSHKQKGSKNRKKAQLRLSRLYRRIKNIRAEFLSFESTKLAKTKSVICIEDLNVSGMMRNHHLARSIGDEGWGDFAKQLEYKTVWYGSRLIKIPRFEPSSKRCSHCGIVNKDLKISDRTWVCLNCGVINERDPNAAHNIRECGIEILATESSSGINACGVGVRLPSLEAVHVEAGRKRVQ